MVLYACVNILTREWHLCAILPVSSNSSSSSPPSLVREDGVVLVAKVQHSCAVCVCCHRSGVVGKRKKRATSPNCHATKVRIPLGIFYRISLRARGEKIDVAVIQSAVAARASEFCSYKVHSLTLEVSWNTSMEFG